MGRRDERGEEISTGDGAACGIPQDPGPTAGLRRAHGAPGLAVVGDTGSVPCASRAPSGADEERRWLRTGTGRSGKGFPPRGALLGQREAPGAAALQRSPLVPDPRRAPQGRRGGRSPPSGRLYRAARLRERFVPLSRRPAAPRSPGTSRPGAGGVRRWVPAPPPRRAPHQQMVLPAAHPRGCGAPTDRTGPGSGTGALRAAWPGRRGNRGGPRRRAQVGRVTCPGAHWLLVCGSPRTGCW